MDVSFYLSDLQSGIEMQVRLLELLRKRVVANKLQLEFRSLTEEELLNREIQMMEDLAQIETLEKIINEKREYFSKYAEYFEGELREANENWDGMLAVARAQAERKPFITDYLKAVDGLGEQLNADYDKKVFLYKRLKALVYGL